MRKEGLGAPKNIPTGEEVKLQTIEVGSKVQIIPLFGSRFFVKVDGMEPTPQENNPRIKVRGLDQNGNIGNKEYFLAGGTSVIIVKSSSVLTRRS